MFYIGFRDQDHAQIGLARSKDGITGWQRHPANPIIRPGKEVGPRRRLQALCDLRRQAVAVVVQRSPRRRRADRIGHPRRQELGILRTGLLSTICGWVKRRSAGFSAQFGILRGRRKPTSAWTNSYAKGNTVQLAANCWSDCFCVAPEGRPSVAQGVSPGIFGDDPKG